MTAAVLATLATLARATVRVTRSGAVRIHLGSVRIYIDADEVSVWRVGAAAIEYRWTTPEPTPEPLTGTPEPLTVPAWTAPARAYRPVWRTYPRPAAWRLAGVA